jgi:REP element-mobilizing transposase RayT
MPRKNLIRSEEFPYHVTSRCNNRDWFYIPLGETWKICNELLREGQKRFEVKIDAFVLMDNHYHMLIYTPKANLDKFMQFFNKNLGARIANKSGRINRVFGAPYKWNLILSQSYYMNVVRYIYQNPLRANICKKCQDYPFSDLRIQSEHLHKINWLNLVLGHEEVARTKNKLRQFVLDISP